MSKIIFLNNWFVAINVCKQLAFNNILHEIKTPEKIPNCLKCVGIS